jgi:hypothetical protein
MTYKNQEYKVDQVLTEILTHDSVEHKYEREVTQAQSRAAKCRKLADGFFKSRQMHPVASDVKALSLLLYRTTAPTPPGRPRKTNGAT